MAAAFSITTGTNAIRLDADRKAVAVFTVVNETGRPLRARASVSPFEPTPLDWFSIDDEAERLFPLDGAEAFTVKIVVPADAPAGRQNFRLDVVSIERPDEEWAHGPAVGFEIAPPPVKPVPPPPKGYVESLGGGIVGSLVGGLAGSLVGLLFLILALSQPFPVLGSRFYSHCQPFFPPFVFCDIPGPLGWSTLISTIVVGAAAGGAIGIVLLLIRRAIAAPEPWKTALPFVLLFLAFSIILGVVWGRVFPPPQIPILDPVQPIPGLVVFVVMTLVAAAVAALAGRAFSRYRTLRTL